MNRNIISVCFTPEQFYHYSDLNSIVVVVDVLRATSVISTVFEYGINAVVPEKSLMKLWFIKIKMSILLLQKEILILCRVLSLEILLFIILTRILKINN